MKTRLLLLPAAGAALALLPVLSSADEIKPKPTVDLSQAVSKKRVEGPVKSALKTAAPTPPVKVTVPTPKRPALWTGASKSGVEGPLLRRLRRGKRIPLATNNKKRKVEAPVRQALGGSPYSPIRPPSSSLNGSLNGSSLLGKSSIDLSDKPLGSGVAKGMVEWPVKRALKRPVPAVAKRTTPQPDPGDRVQPGLVTWHKSYEAALAAAKQSGKPVMLLHTLGRLDDRFC